jgi:small-conductance mechanosensitive channel
VAQGEETAPAPEEAAPAEVPPEEVGPRPVAPAEIAGQAETVRLRTREIQSALELGPVLRQIEERLPELGKLVETLQAGLDVEALEGRSVQEIEDRIFRWQGVEKQLANWTAELSARVKELGDHLRELKQAREIWQLTKGAAEESDLPEASLERIDTTLQTIVETELEVQDARNLRLTLQERVSGRLEAIREGVTDLTSARDERRSNLLASESAPLWEVTPRWSHLRDLFVELSAASQMRRAQLTAFVSTNEPLIIVHGLLLIVFLVTVLTLRRRSRAWDREDPQVARVATLLDRPISAAVLMAALLLPLLYPPVPLVVGNLISLFLLIPVIRMLVVLLPSSLHPGVYLLAPFYVANRLVLASPALSPGVRYLLFLETAFGFAVVLWALRRGLAVWSERRGGWISVVRLVLRAAAAGLVISLVVNLIGKAQLAELLATGSLRSIYILLVLYAAGRVLDAVTWGVLHTEAARRLPSVRHHSELIRERAQKLIRLLIAALYVYLVLEVFGVLAPAGQVMASILGAGFKAGDFDIDVGSILTFVIVFWLSLQISRFVRFALEQDVLPRMALGRGVPQAVSTIVHYVVLLIGFFIAASAAGFGLSNLVLLTGALGVGIGFGLQNIVNNFVSGLILLFERPIKVGDVVEVGALMGTVRHIGMRASTVRTWEGAEVIVPNGEFISAQVVNWTLSDRTRRIDISVGVAYGTDPETVIDLLTKVARENDEVLGDPEPNALFMGFGDSSLNFSLRAWTRVFDSFLRVRSALTVAVNAAIREAGIEIPFPQRDLHLRSLDDPAEESLGAIARGERRALSAPAEPGASDSPSEAAAAGNPAEGESPEPGKV